MCLDLNYSFKGLNISNPTGFNEIKWTIETEKVKRVFLTHLKLIG